MLVSFSQVETSVVYDPIPCVLIDLLSSTHVKVKIFLCLHYSQH